MLVTTPEDREDAERRGRQLVIDYKQLFKSETGARVLKDLEDAYGWLRASATPEATDGNIVRRECRKHFLYHIHGMVDMVLEDAEKKPKTARSAHGEDEP